MDPVNRIPRGLHLPSSKSASTLSIICPTLTRLSYWILPTLLAMPKQKISARQGTTSRSSSQSDHEAGPTLPLPEYLAKQGVLTCLLLFSTLLLPQTSWFKVAPVTPTSTDRPEPPFMAAMTGDPAKTMLCSIAGVITCMLWWTPTLRAWWSPKKAADRQLRVAETVRVGHSGCSYRRKRSSLISVWEKHQSRH
jgi:hypothetical protein